MSGVCWLNFSHLQGDFYRGCGCYKRLWWTGKVVDCNKGDCAKSKAHAHRTTSMCYCALVCVLLRLPPIYY
ncbi:hypothetical protein M422DRAFT_171654 [Sphaerobolus stellatus SS14]|uniref:Uncharacterized protein n=1 Tax=Sphaerobolus stellatus (strain SS14) TaxID=990650 RepID=A0A0C9V4X3_SPHS4|nr:hypothetical protein M422DRAFT_171654 [Sphaerobolus stellatus SS14]